MPEIMKLKARERHAGAVRLSTLAVELLPKGQREPPTEFRIFAQGNTATKKGVFSFDKESAASVQKHAKDWGNDYSLDYDHGAFSLFSTPGAGMAAGWYKLDVRDGELWAVDIEWTEKATAHLQSREYRYFSPTFRHEEGGRILELLNVALTNIPATKGMKPLMASLVGEDADDESPTTPEEVPPMKTLMKMLGLSDTATEAEAMAALQTKLGETAGDSATLRQLTSLTGKSSLTECLGVVQAWKVGSDKAVELATKLAEQSKLARDTEVETLLSAAEKDGRFSPGLRKTMASVIAAMKPEELKAFLSAMPKLAPEQIHQPSTTAPGPTVLSAVDLEVSKSLGVSPEDFIKLRQADEAYQRQLGFAVP